jgi:hypothetical protein
LTIVYSLLTQLVAVRVISDTPVWRTRAIAFWMLYSARIGPEPKER